MKLTAKVSGLSEALKTAEIIASMQAMKAMRIAEGGLKEELRDQVRAAGLGERLAKTWQGKIYPGKGVALDPAAYVFSKAPGIIDAYARGVTIVAKAGRRLLAIPTDDVPKQRNGRALTPLQVEAKFGRRLRFVPAKSAQGSRARGGRAVAYLVLDRLRRQKTSGRFRNASARELAKNREEAVVMFDLVTSVKVPKKLDLQGALGRASTTLQAVLAQPWSDA